MKDIGDWGRILFYLLIGIIIFLSKRAERKTRKNRKQFDFPNADPSETAQQPLQPVTEQQPKPAKKLRKQKPKAAAAAEAGYFTYENETDYKARAAERKEQAKKQTVETEVQGSAETDFDLRTAIIASEILKPKFDE